MTVFELHLEVEQKLQELFSSKHDRILPDAIDLALRQAEEQYIKQNIDVRFEDRETKLKNIKAILEKNVQSDVYIPQIADTHYETNSVFTTFPANFLYGINYRAEVATNKVNCDIAPVIDTLTSNEFVTVLPFPTTTLTIAPYYTGFKIRNAASTIIYTTPIAFANRFVVTDQKYEIISNVLDTINYSGAVLQVYWEEYKSLHKPGCFIFVNITNDVSMTATIYQPDGTTPDATSTASTTITERIIYNRTTLQNLPNTTILTRPLKLIEGDFHYKSQNLNSFTKTKSREPHAIASDDFVHIYTDESFIVTRATFDYIRKPRQISLVLNQTSELDSSIHRELVDRAVELLKKNIQDPTLQSDVQYNELRTRN